MLKNISISSGNFTANGNFTGYNLLGERVHIYKRQMEQLGWAKDADVKFPFYTVATVKEYQKVDENGEPTDETFDRLTATSVFKDEISLIGAHVANASTDAKINSAIAKAMKDIELTDEQLATLANSNV
jgi:hypothetical protein